MAANTNRNRKTRPSKTKNKKAGENYFNKKSLAILMMVFSLVLEVFLISSKTGRLGLFVSDGLSSIFGILAYIFPILIFVSFLFAYRSKYLVNIKPFLLIYLIYIFTLVLFSARFKGTNLQNSLSMIETNLLKSGGLLGGYLAHFFLSYLGLVGVWMIYIFLWIAFVVNVSKFTYKDFFQGLKRFIAFIGRGIYNLFAKISQKIKLLSQKKKEKDKEKDQEDSFNIKDNLGGFKEETEPIIEDTFIEKKDFSKEKIKEKTSPLQTATIHQYTDRKEDLSEFDHGLKREEDTDYNFPSIDLLDDPQGGSEIDRREIENKAKQIEETLESFGIAAKVVQINVGPTVTCYELKPSRGIKVSRILNLADDLSLALATSEVRIEAPIPGKSHVGIEVANDHKEMVLFKEMITAKEYTNSKYKIPFALGKSISGKTEVYGIEKTPHLLISGATGSGKSVCINTVIMSILYKHSPDEVKLLLIDPKVVELSIYNGTPHLIMPVITDPKKAASSLFWAITEMERRYRLFEETRVRDISSYRHRQKTDDTMEKLPYIIIIIDELSDLMMTAAGEVEDYITRLAQKSRACGIHLIIATQRPTVDVITGTIKANIPSRIAFAVSSQIDSRTILDMSGAEKLLGKGDMLFAPSDAMKPLRIQGAFVSDDEVLRVVNAIKKVNTSDYNEEAIETVDQKTEIKENPDEDELIGEAIKIIVQEQTASVSLLQRKLKVGYARAGRIIDQLEQRGIVGGYEGSKPRKVLVDRNYLEGE